MFVHAWRSVHFACSMQLHSLPDLCFDMYLSQIVENWFDMSTRGDELFVVKVRLQCYKNYTSFHTLPFPHRYVHELNLLPPLQHYHGFLEPLNDKFTRKRCSKCWQCGLDSFTSIQPTSQLDQQQRQLCTSHNTACLLGWINIRLG